MKPIVRYGGHMKYIDIVMGETGFPRSEIVYEYCPGCFNDAFPNYDVNTFKFTEKEGDEPGCHGKTCSECWNTGIKAR